MCLLWGRERTPASRDPLAVDNEDPRAAVHWLIPSPLANGGSGRWCHQPFSHFTSHPLSIHVAVVCRRLLCVVYMNNLSAFIDENCSFFDCVGSAAAVCLPTNRAPSRRPSEFPSPVCVFIKCVCTDGKRHKFMWLTDKNASPSFVIMLALMLRPLQILVNAHTN